MKAAIMAGGLGKRLRPLTDTIPKALITVGGKPIIHWQIKWLEASGIHEFVLLCGYKSRKLIEYVESIGRAESFDFSVESAPLGTAGAIKKANRLLGGEDHFLVVNGDNITDIEIAGLSLKGRDLCCLSLVPYRSSKGIVKFKGSRVLGFDEKPLIEGYWFNAGVSLLSSELLSGLPRKGSLESEVFPRLAKSGRLSCARYANSYFNSVDTFKDMEEIDKDLKSGKVKFK